MVKHMVQGQTRRSFYGFFINLLGTGIAAIVGIPAALYLLLKPNSTAIGDLIEVADLDSVPTDKPKEVLFTHTRIDGWKKTREKTSTWLVKDAAGKVTAFAPACTHLGCAYHWEADAKNFLCPCHDSVFDVSGKVLSGPAPRPLDRFSVEIDNGKVLVNPNSISESKA
jgi:menaquinol-cytochrome c reductase iron-sulfur subunit